MGHINVFPGKPYPLGASVLADGTVNFAAVDSGSEESGVILYQNGKELARLSFSDGNRIGNVRSILVDGLQELDFQYSFFSGENEYPDPFSRVLHGEWPEQLSGLDREIYNWEGDCAPGNGARTENSDSILYLIHPAGFTKDPSSGVSHPGTFQGIMEKIPYLKALGITALELMPAYDFPEQEADGKINFWGYKSGYYFAPKASYCASGSPAREFRDLVKALHRAGIEVVMQFYFPAEIRRSLIADVLRNWGVDYHVDGFHLLGWNLPVGMLREDPVLSGCRIFYEDNYHDGFLVAARRFLRGEEWSLTPFLDAQRSLGNIKYITNYSGFSLADLVSYDRKHNEANGEENRDGENYNISWNCGCEGETEDSVIRALRMRQIKNAFAFLLGAQGTPMIVAGDEFGFSRGGNNNSWCQDNEVNWLDWNGLEENRELFSFVKKLTALRRSLSGLGQAEQESSPAASGYPFCSYHGEEAWWLELDGWNRHAGIMYCIPEKRESEHFLLLCYNMHQETCQLALPQLPKGMEWSPVLDTADKANAADAADTAGENTLADGRILELEGHSVRILQGIRR